MAVTYYLSAFDAAQAQRGKLCVATTYTYSGSTIDTDSSSFKVATVPTVVSTKDYSVVINGATCVFDEKGYPKDISSKNYKLWMASTEMNVEQYGSAVRRARKVVTTRSADGTYSTNEDAGEGGNIMLSTLTPRDNFAMQALKAIIPTLPDLKNIGDTERTFYCNLAYQWAANMMDRAAQSRADFKDDTAEPTTTGVEVGELETNTDKLLNNLVATLEKTQSVIIDGQQQVVSERISIPKLMEWLNTYSHHTSTGAGDTKTTVGLDDLINAIKSISSGQGSGEVEITDIPDINIGNAGLGRDSSHPLHISITGLSDVVTQLTNINTTLGQIKTAVEGLQPTPDPEPENNVEE